MIQSRKLWVDSFLTHYLQAGDPSAPTVVLLHDGAWGGDATASWEHVIPLLAGRFHVVAPDLLGFGGTDKAVIFNRDRFEYRAHHVARFLAVIGSIEPAHFVGASFGGTLLLRTLVDRPRYWNAASAVSIGGDGGMYRNAENFAKLMSYDGSRSAMERTVQFLIAGGDFDRQVQYRHESVRRAGSFQALSSLRLDRLDDEDPASYPDTSFPHGLSDVGVPLMLVAGVADYLLLPDWPERVKEFASAARIVRLPGRHSPNIDRPEEVVALLEDFWSSLSADRTVLDDRREVLST
jgi:pimeloyl-ACP methyl ester carboxylesterase